MSDWLSIQINSDTNNIYLIKLLSGDSFICRLSKHATSGFVCSEPMKVNINDFDDGFSAMSMIREMPYLKENKVRVKEDHIVYAELVSDDMRVFYTKTVEYNNRFIDAKFNEALKDATAQTEEVMDVAGKIVKEGSSAISVNKEEIEEKITNVLKMLQSNNSNTKH